MTPLGHQFPTSSRRLRVFGSGVILVLGMLALPTFALAATPIKGAALPPPQGSWTSYGILSNTGVTNTGPSTVQGNLGSSGNSSATAVTGFFPSGPGTVTGQIVLGGAAITAQTDATAAVNSLEAQSASCTTLTGDLAGMALNPGVYCFSAGLSGILTLNAGSDPNAVFIFLTPNSLIVNPNSQVILNGSSTCNVYWRTNALASLDTNVKFVGNIFASSQVTMNAGTTLLGRAIAQTANVTLISDSILSGCAAGATPTAVPTGSVTVVPTGSATVVPTGSATVVPTGSATVVPTGSVTVVPGGSPTATPVPSSCVGNIRGSKQDGSGLGLANWTVQLLQGGQVIRTTTTDAAGNYNFLGVPLGAYTVQEVQPAGWHALLPTSIAVTLSSCNQNLTGYAFADAPGNGTVAPAVTVVATATPLAAATAVIPTSLPHTGGSIPWGGALGLLVGIGLVGAGLTARRARN